MTRSREMSALSPIARALVRLDRLLRGGRSVTHLRRVKAVRSSLYLAGRVTDGDHRHAMIVIDGERTS